MNRVRKKSKAPKVADQTAAVAITLATHVAEQSAAQGKQELARLEAKIHKGLATYCDVEQSFFAIGLRKLWMLGRTPERKEYESYLHYLKVRWHSLSTSHIYRLADAVDVAHNVFSPTGENPTHERQLRPLVREPLEAQLAAWNAAVEAAGGQPTEEQVRAELEALAPSRLAPEKQREQIIHDEARAKAAIKRDAVKQRIDQIERLVSRLRRLHAGLPDVADAADKKLDEYLRVVGATGEA